MKAIAITTALYTGDGHLGNNTANYVVSWLHFLRFNTRLNFLLHDGQPFNDVEFTSMMIFGV